MSNKPEDLEQNGNDLLASWQPSGSRKIKIAPDVQSGDCVWLNGETGQYEKVTTASAFHGIFDGYDVKIVAAYPLIIRHSLLDGEISLADDMPESGEE